MACNALLGKDASVTIAGIGSGYLRDYSVNIGVELIDATGIGSGTDYREKIVHFGTGSFTGTGLTSGGGGSGSPGDLASVTTITLSTTPQFIITSIDEKGTWDGFIEVSISGEATACGGA